jgi:hypothetical protein
MALYTKNYLRQVAGTETLTESTRLLSQRSEKHTAFDIFLCHSYLDKSEIKGLYLELTRMSLSVYVDWIVDPHLVRSHVTKEAAELIRGRLRSSKSLLLAFSINAGMSKWMPLELGYVDGHMQTCAIIPVADSSQASYDRSEYLLLYPEILRPGTVIQHKDPLYVMNDANTYVNFRDWFKGVKPAYQSVRLF